MDREKTSIGQNPEIHDKTSAPQANQPEDTRAAHESGRPGSNGSLENH